MRRPQAKASREAGRAPRIGRTCPYLTGCGERLATTRRSRGIGPAGCRERSPGLPDLVQHVRHQGDDHRSGDPLSDHDFPPASPIERTGAGWMGRPRAAADKSPARMAKTLTVMRPKAVARSALLQPRGRHRVYEALAAIRGVRTERYRTRSRIASVRGRRSAWTMPSRDRCRITGSALTGARVLLAGVQSRKCW